MRAVTRLLLVFTLQSLLFLYNILTGLGYIHSSSAGAQLDSNNTKSTEMLNEIVTTFSKYFSPTVLQCLPAGYQKNMFHLVLEAFVVVSSRWKKRPLFFL